MKDSESHSVVSDSLQHHGLYSPWNSLGQNTGVGDLVAQSCLTLATPWTMSCQAPLSMGFSRQESWRGLSSPSPGDLPDPGVEPRSPAPQTDSLLTKPPGKADFDPKA